MTSCCMDEKMVSVFRLSYTAKGMLIQFRRVTYDFDRRNMIKGKVVGLKFRVI